MSEDCPVTPWRENHVWSSAKPAVHKRDGEVCAWPKCPRRGGEVNHITPRRGAKLGTRGCMHHLDNLETLCEPHHRRVTKYEDRAALGLPTFLYADDGWLPGDTVGISDIARMLDTARSSVSTWVTAYYFPLPIGGQPARRGQPKKHLRWPTPVIVEWACERGFLDSWDLHPHLAAMLPQEVAA